MYKIIKLKRLEKKEKTSSDLNRAYHLIFRTDKVEKKEENQHIYIYICVCVCVYIKIKKNIEVEPSIINIIISHKNTTHTHT